MMKALPIYVYRNRSVDCTNDGVSARYDKLLLACDDGYVEVDEQNPPENLVRMVKRYLFGQDVYHIRPWKEPEGIGWMFGGNFAHTSDSRFSRMCGGQYGAIAIHDRQE